MISACAHAAGACNAVLGFHGDDSVALSHLHIAALQHALLLEQGERKVQTLERSLEGLQLKTVVSLLEEDLSQDGRSLGGRKEKGRL